MDKWEAKQDEKEYRQIKAGKSTFTHQLTASAETEPVQSADENDDAADDPAIWYNKANPAKSLIFGSNKTAGIHTYNLSGKEVQFVACGKINNVDIRQDVLWGRDTVDVVAGSDRTDYGIVFFIIDDAGRIEDKPNKRILLESDFEPYGFCLARDTSAVLHAYVNRKDGSILHYTLQPDTTDEKVDIRLARTLQVDSQPEGMVVDDERSLLYVGEEQHAIHIFSASASGPKTSLVMKSSMPENNPKIAYDLEGLALLPPHYLVASSQGNFSYAIFRTDDLSYLTSFVVNDGTFDGIEETDGLDLIARPLSSKYPHGIFVAQDGFNYDGETKVNQNFKIVDLSPIRALLGEGDGDQ